MTTITDEHRAKPVEIVREAQRPFQFFGWVGAIAAVLVLLLGIVVFAGGETEDSSETASAGSATGTTAQQISANFCGTGGRVSLSPNERSDEIDIPVGCWVRLGWARLDKHNCGPDYTLEGVGTGEKAEGGMIGGRCVYPLLTAAAAVALVAGDKPVEIAYRFTPIQ